MKAAKMYEIKCFHDPKWRSPLDLLQVILWNTIYHSSEMFSVIFFRGRRGNRSYNQPGMKIAHWLVLPCFWEILPPLDSDVFVSSIDANASTRFQSKINSSPDKTVWFTQEQCRITMCDRNRKDVEFSRSSLIVSMTLRDTEWLRVATQRCFFFYKWGVC
jgi:hypothetical protein